MDFWLEDSQPSAATPSTARNRLSLFSSSEQHQSTNSTPRFSQDTLTLSQESRLSLSQESTVQQPLSQQEFVCAFCDGTDYYPDPATGRPVCTSCFTQSQSQLTVTAEDEQEDDYEDAMAVAAKKAGGIRASSSAYETVGLDGRIAKRKRFEDYSSATELPELETCLTAMKFILKTCLRIVYSSNMIQLEPDERREVTKIAKHLFLGYIRSWALCADNVGERFPELYLSMRDLFLERKYRTGVERVLMDYALRSEDNKGVDPPNLGVDHANVKLGDGKEGDGIFGEDHAIINQDETQSPSQNGGDDSPGEKGNESTKKHYRGDNSGKSIKRIEKLYGDATTNHTHQLWAVYCGGGRPNNNNKTRIGPQEAAFLLHPDMTMIAAIVWLAGARRGLIMPHHVIEWISNGTLPLEDAYVILPEQHQQDLRLAKSAFQMSFIPSPFVLEQVGSLLLVAAGLKTNNAFSNGLSLPQSKRGSPQLIPTMSESGVYVHIAQLVADLGLGQTILDTALGMIGAKGIGHPQLKGVNASKITSACEMAAVILMAIEVQPDWWKYVAVRSKQSTVATFDDDILCKPVRTVRSTNDLNQLKSGAEFDAYLDYCQGILEPCPKKSKFMPSSLEAGLSLVSNPFDDDGSESRVDSSSESVRPCQFLAQIPVHESNHSEYIRRTALQERIVKQLRDTEQKSRKRSFSENRTRVTLHQREAFLVEFLADFIWVESAALKHSLAKLLKVKKVS